MWVFFPSINTQYYRRTKYGIWRALDDIETISDSISLPPIVFLLPPFFGRVSDKSRSALSPNPGSATALYHE